VPVPVCIPWAAVPSHGPRYPREAVPPRNLRLPVSGRLPVQAPPLVRVPGHPRHGLAWVSPAVGCAHGSGAAGALRQLDLAGAVDVGRGALSNCSLRPHNNGSQLPDERHRAGAGWWKGCRPKTDAREAAATFFQAKIPRAPRRRRRTTRPVRVTRRSGVRPAVGKAPELHPGLTTRVHPGAAGLWWTQVRATRGRLSASDGDCAGTSSSVSPCRGSAWLLPPSCESDDRGASRGGMPGEDKCFPPPFLLVPTLRDCSLDGNSRRLSFQRCGSSGRGCPCSESRMSHAAIPVGPMPRVP